LRERFNRGNKRAVFAADMPSKLHRQRRTPALGLVRFYIVGEFN